MKKTLLTAFAGKTNSSKLLLDEINVENKLILTNSFVSCEKQMIEAIHTINPDLILAFGQKPKTDCIYIETQAHKNDIIKTSFVFSGIIKSLNERNIRFKLSDNAGNYLCNHVYYEGLRYIKDHKLSTKMIFIHVPSKKDFVNFDAVSRWLNQYVEELL